MRLYESRVNEAVAALQSAVFEEQARDKFGLHALAEDGYSNWAFAATDGGGHFVAGVTGETYSGGLLIDRLLCAPEYRHSGIGGHLLQVALAYARARGEVIATVETFECQAPSFYPRHGFAFDFRHGGLRHGSVSPGDVIYFSRKVSTADIDALPSCELPVSGSASDAAGSGRPFVTRNGSVVTVSYLAAETPERAALDLFLEEGFQAHALATLGGISPRVPFCFTACNCVTQSALAADSTMPTSESDDRVTTSIPTGSASGSWHPLEAPCQHPVGAISGNVYWGCLTISAFVVAKAVRRQGVGKALLQRCIEHAVSTGCYLIALRTFDYQAPHFYERYGGFSLDYSQTGWRDGTTELFYRRVL